MKKIRKSFALIVSLTIIISTLTSCDFLNNDTYDELDLIGTWNIDDASATAKVLGVDLLNVLTTTFNFAEDSAQAKFDTIASEFLNTMAGTMIFYDDYNYSLNLSELDAENGTWTMDGEKGEITMTKEGEGELGKIYSLESLDNLNMILDMPAEEIPLDLNNDGTTETNVKLVIVVELSKLN